MGGRRRGACRPDAWWRLILVLTGALLTARAAVAADADAPAAIAGQEQSEQPQEQSQQPVRQYVDATGRPCRVYARQIVIDGAAQTAYVTVCRDPDGRWVIAR